MFTALSGNVFQEFHKQVADAHIMATAFTVVDATSYLLSLATSYLLSSEIITLTPIYVVLYQSGTTERSSG